MTWRGPPPLQVHRAGAGSACPDPSVWSTPTSPDAGPSAFR
jgi:hypothetical protein